MTDSHKNGFWLDKTSDEYASVKFYTEMCLGGGKELDTLEVWRVVNEEHTLLFNREYEGNERVIAWKNVKEIPPMMLKNLGREGFTFSPASGMSFTLGNLEIEDPPAKLGSATVAVHEYSFVYCEAVIGRALATDEIGLKTNAPTTADSFDSYWVSPSHMDSNGDGVFSLTEYKHVARFNGRAAEAYRHKYVLRNCRAVLPKYVIKARIVPKGSTPKPAISLQERTKAASCFVEPATLTIVPVEDVKNIRQGMLPAGQVYDQAVLDLTKPDPLTSKKKVTLDKLLQELDDKARDVNLHYAEAFETIQKAAAQATQILQKKTRVKLEEILSIEVALRREVEHLEWMEGHMRSKAAQSAADKPAIAQLMQEKEIVILNSAGEYGGTVATPDVLEFISSYKAYLGYRHDKTRSKPMDITQQLNDLDTDVTAVPDIAVYGSREEAMRAQALVAARQMTHGAGRGSSLPGISAEEALLHSMSQGDANDQDDINGPKPASPKRKTLRGSVWGRSSTQASTHLGTMGLSADVATSGMAPLAQFIMQAVQSDSFGEPPVVADTDTMRAGGRPVMDDAMKRISKG